MRTHVIKITDDNWENIELGRKRFEVRFNDRNYQLGDKIKFMDEDGVLERWTGGHKEAVFKIIFVQSGYGLEKDFVVLGIKEAS